MLAVIFFLIYLYDFMLNYNILYINYLTLNS